MTFFDGILVTLIAVGIFAVGLALGFILGVSADEILEK